MFKRESKKRRFNLDWLAVATLAVMLILPAQARALVIADAGPDQIVWVGKTVQLHGDATDNEGNTTQFWFNWYFISKPTGSSTSISGSWDQDATFVPDLEGEYRVQLDVFSDTGDVSSDTLVVLVSDNIGPTAVINTDVISGRAPLTVTFDASGSSDPEPNGYIDSYLWDLGDESSASGVNPVHVYSAPGEYTVTLRVINNEGSWGTERVLITVEGLIADAGSDRYTWVGKLVQMEGAGWDTEYPETNLYFAWSICATPEGSMTALSSPNLQNPTFAPDLAGEYMIVLTVTSTATGEISEPDTVVVHVNTLAVDASPDQIAWPGKTVQLHGEATDTEGNATQFWFNWCFISKPTGSSTSISGSWDQDATFVPDLIGEYTIKLAVFSDTGDQSSDTLVVHVSGSGETEPGGNVVVEPVDPSTGESPVALAFDNVTSSGVTTVVSTSPSETHGAPLGFKAGQPPTIFHIDTTATFDGSVQVCLDYSGVSFHDETVLRLFHFDNEEWVDVTTSLDTENYIICGEVSSLSPFAAFEVSDPVQIVQELTQDVIDLNLHSGIENSLDTKLDAALKAIEDLNENNDVAAVNSLGAFINAVEAQRGNKIPEADADALITAAQQIIDLLLAE